MSDIDTFFNFGSNIQLMDLCIMVKQMREDIEEIKKMVVVVYDR